MPAMRITLASVAAALSACATDTPAPEPDLPPLTEPDIQARAAERVRQGRDRGFPDLSRVPARAESLPTPQALTTERGTLEEEAHALAALREAAARGTDTGALAREGQALRAAIARDRAVQASQEPISAPPPPPARRD